MKLIDTDIAIDHFHRHQAALDYFTHTAASGEPLAISVVTLTELAGGMRPGEEVRTERLLDLFTVLDVDELNWAMPSSQPRRPCMARNSSRATPSITP